jgi:hypothetical protein
MAVERMGMLGFSVRMGMLGFSVRMMEARNVKMQ